MKYRFGFLGAVVVLLLTSQPTQATVVLTDDFQGYADQAAFQIGWPVIGTTAPSSNVFTTTAIAGGSTKWVSQPSVSSTTGTYRNRRSFAETGVVSATNAVMYSFDFFDGNGTASPYRSHANLHDTTAPGSSNQLVSMGLNNNLATTADGGNFYMARVLSYDGGTGVSAYFKLNQGSAPVRSTGWHNLKVVITNTNMRFYVDGILSSTDVTGGTLRSYDNVALGSGVSSTSNGGFDNVRVINDQLAVAATLVSPPDQTTPAVGTQDGLFVDVNLDWASPTNNKYDLYLWEDGDPVPVTPTAAGITATDSLADNLLPNTLYHWKVDTYNEFDDKFSAVDVWDFTTIEVPEPTSLAAAFLGMGLLLRRKH